MESCVTLVTSLLSQLCMTVGSGLCSGPGTTDTLQPHNPRSLSQPPNTAVPDPASAVLAVNLINLPNILVFLPKHLRNVMIILLFSSVVSSCVMCHVSMKTAMETDRWPLRRGGGEAGDLGRSLEPEPSSPGAGPCHQPPPEPRPGARITIWPHRDIWPQCSHSIHSIQHFIGNIKTLNKNNINIRSR